MQYVIGFLALALYCTLGYGAIKFICACIEEHKVIMKMGDELSSIKDSIENLSEKIRQV